MSTRTISSSTGPPGRARLAPAALFPSLLGPSRRAGWRRLALRRGLAAGLLLLAVHLTISLAAGPAPGPQVLIAERDLASGARLTAGDLRWGPAPSGFAAGVTDPGELVGRRVGVPLARGEVITAARVVGSAALAQVPGAQRTLSVPVLDVTAAEISPGERVDVYRPGGRAAVVRDALVVQAPPEQESEGGGLGGAGGLSPGARVSLGLSDEEVQGLVGAMDPGLEVGFVLVARPD